LSILDKPITGRSLPNSTAMSLGPVALNWIRDAFEERDSQSVLCLNFVAVRGPRPPGEALHFHTGHILGYATAGEGFAAHTAADGKESTTPVKKGDIFVLPAFVRHTFFTPSNGALDYVVLEFGPKADGQRHHYGST
jgi:uncharacterized RmlC-like cupin family protein